MTLVASLLNAERAYIVTDTASYDADDLPETFSTKAFALPHIGCVIVDRGATFMAFGFLQWALGALLPAGLDDLKEQAPEALKDLHEEFIDRFGAVLDEDAGQHKAETMVFGYSQAADRIEGYNFVSDEGFAPRPVPDGEAYAPLPQLDRSDPFVEGVVQKHMVALSNQVIPEFFVAVGKLQRWTIQQEKRRCVPGGDLILCELTKSGISFRRIHRFHDYDKMLAAMSAEEEDA